MDDGTNISSVSRWGEPPDPRKISLDPATGAGLSGWPGKFEGSTTIADWALPLDAPPPLVADSQAGLLRNILIITSDEGEPGTLLGTMFNESDSPVQVTIDGENESSQITIEANDKYVFEDEVDDDGTLQGISEIPGALVDLDFTVNSESQTFRVPVLDGTLEEYREYVPGGFTPEPSPSVEAGVDDH
mgnify:CR=1 FL=1